MRETAESPAQLQPDFGKTITWPDGYWEHFNRFRQGHILEDVPLLYLGSVNQPLWAAEIETLRHGFSTGLHAVMEKGVPLRHAMVTTQGCDIVKHSHAWISVAPVYDATAHFDRGALGHIKAGRILHLLPLTPPWGESEQKWVADLRIEIPIEKTVLLDRTPLEAYAQDSDYQRVPIRLAFLRQRAAVADLCLQRIAQPLFDWVRQRDQATQELMLASVDHIRIWQDNHESPSQARLYVILKESAAVGHDLDLWDAAEAHVYEQSAGSGIVNLPIKTCTMSELTAAEYTASHLVEDGGSS